MHPTDQKDPDETSFGAQLMRDGGTRFRLWAPSAQTVDLMLSALDDRGQTGRERRQPMQRLADSAAGTTGWYEWRSPQNLAGAHYGYLINGSQRIPDPASRWNPDDVAGASVVCGTGEFHWTQTQWAGLPWHRIVIYELHIGTFTAAGTFLGAIERLDDLAELGITAIEIMPVADYPGRRNWGYDGVLHFAPDAAFGSPDDLRRLIDAAHQRGIAVFLDVVYNHFGPQGNYLHDYAPAFFTERHQTPWGAAINFDDVDSAVVRRFYLENAWHWIDDFKLDGLRFDAVHAIKDDSATHLMAEIASDLRRRLAAQPGVSRQIHLILENDKNQASLLQRNDAGAPLIATAQWNDDIHHALHVLITDETDGYYADFAEQPAQRLADGLANGFIYRGQPSAHAGGAPRGEATDGLTPLAFINFLQNHDQIGNRAFGDRIGAIAPVAAVRAAIGCVLLGPAIPMIFMGDEFAASSPFQYFCDFDGELATAIRDGRRREFGRFARFSSPEVRDRIPDPCALQTFQDSVLPWSEADRGEHARMRAFYRECLAARRSHVEPLLVPPATCRAEVRMLGERAFLIRWEFGAGSIALAVNFEAHSPVTLSGAEGRVVYAVNDVATAGPEHLTTLGPWGLALIA